ncbi:MAG: V-type ATP synthase subunit A, partial [Clostridiales Family XIII bacterium]|nr:V-type ATP synthase subunit A [Clostridiales Family XIII bacterium]
MNEGRIVKVSGPLVVAEGMQDADMFDVVRVGDQGLIGEIIEMRGDRASIQVYEETAGLGPGAKVVSTGVPLSVELGPGMLENIYDGIQRPLTEMLEISGPNIKRGIDLKALSRTKRWKFVPTVEAGQRVQAGDVIGTVKETVIVEIKIMVPYGIEGVVKE